jgi:carboxymethylenebutenolidase
MNSSTIQLKVNETTTQAYLALPAGGKGPGVLVLHAWWGLKPFFGQVCDRLAEQGFVAFAPDLYHGPLAKTIEEAQALHEAADSQLMGDTVMAAKDFLLTHPANTAKKIGAVGFSMGAAWALIAATYAPDQVAAVAAFYGAGEADFSKMKARFLGHYSDVDEWETLEWVRVMETAMKSAGVDVSLHIYPGLGHWFVEEDRPEYDPAAAKLAWERTFAFLKENVR